MTQHGTRSDRDGFSLAANVAAGASGETTQTMPADGTVEKVAIRIYAGPQNDLDLEPFILTKDGTRKPLIKLAGKSVIDGDDDTYEWDVAKPIQKDDEIVIKHTNNDTTEAYDYRVNVSVDYESGLKRSLSGLVSGVL